MGEEGYCVGRISLSLTKSKGVFSFSCNKEPIQWHLVLSPFEDSMEIWHRGVIKQIHGTATALLRWCFSSKFCAILQILHISLISFSPLISFEVKDCLPFALLCRYDLLHNLLLLKDKHPQSEKNHWLNCHHGSSASHTTHSAGHHSFIKLKLKIFACIEGHSQNKLILTNSGFTVMIFTEIWRIKIQFLTTPLELRSNVHHLVINFYFMRRYPLSCNHLFLYKSSLSQLPSKKDL